MNIKCWLGHKYEIAFHITPIKTRYGFLSYGLASKCIRCGKVESEYQNSHIKELPIVIPFEE